MGKRASAFILFLLFFTITLILYWRTSASRFVFDYVDWHFTYSQQGFKGLLHSFGDPSLHYGYHAVYFVMHRLFGMHALPWLLTFTAMHALNATLLYSFLKKIFYATHKNGVPLLSFASALFFLISPYQTEVIVWGATIHYLLAGGLMLLILNVVLSRLTPLKYVLVYLLFFTALFVHEITMVLPATITVLVALAPARLWHFTRPRSIFWAIVLPLFILVAAYFALNKLILGQWVGHYGASTHLRFHLWEMAAALYKYAAKYLLFAQFLPGAIKAKVYGAGTNRLLLTGMAAAGIVVIIMTVYYRPNQGRLLLFLITASCLALFPVLNLYFPDYINIHADRLGYIGSLFLYPLLAFIIWWIFKKDMVVLFLIAVISVLCLTQNTASWQNAHSIMATLDNTFPVAAKGRIYILNLPDNYRGAYMYRSLGASKFARAYKMKTGIDLEDRITEVAAFNLQTASDSVTISILDSNTIKVQLTSPGSWYWRYTLGAEDYDEELVKADFDETGRAYTAVIKHKQKGDIFIYQAGKQWHQIQNF